LGGGKRGGRRINRSMCNVNERIGLAWFGLGIWELKYVRRGAEIGIYPLCNEELN
jgi:hypothetical protein